jgi:hypothetical protein
LKLPESTLSGSFSFSITVATIMALQNGKTQNSEIAVRFVVTRKISRFCKNNCAKQWAK